MADARSEIYTWGERKFCDIPETYINSTIKNFKGSNENCGKLCEYIQRNCLGRDLELAGPFGRRKGLFMVYRTLRQIRNNRF